MESQSSTKRIKFSRLCLSQGRSTKDGQSSNNSVQSLQISKFFNRPSPTDNINPSTSSAIHPRIDEEKPLAKDSTSSSNSKLLKINETFSVTDDVNAKGTKGTQNVPEIERAKTKRLFDESNTKADSKKTIKNFFAADNNESLSDFEVPNKVARKSSTKTTKKARTTKSRSRKQPDIRKILQKRNDGVDLNEDEELQFAMELSKAESNEQIDPTNLDQFEYKPKNGTRELASIFGAQKTSKVQNKWKSKCTPLTRRDVEVQSLKTRERVDELLMDNIMISSRKSRESEDSMGSAVEFVFDISSKILQRICMPEKILFELNDSDVQSDRCIHQYYTNNLVERSAVAVGALLRDWNEIPGRDSVFDGIPATLNQTQEVIGDELEHPSESTGKELAECVDRASSDSDHCEMPVESENYVTSSMNDVEEITASADTEATIIVDTNDIEVELNLINSRIRSSQNFVESHAPICYSETVAVESHRGPSPDLFDDDDYDYDANYSESDAMTCSNNQSNSENNVVVVEDSPVVDMNDENSSNEIIVNETVASPTLSLNLSNDDKFSVIEISDESNHSTVTKNPIKEEDSEEYTVATDPAIVATSSSLRKVLSFTERLELMDRDVLGDFNLDVPINILDSVENNEMKTSQQMTQESIELSDDEINYSMNFGKNTSIDVNEMSSPTTALNEPRNHNEDEDFNFDYGCNAMDGVNDLELVNQSICDMFEKTFEYRDASKGNENRDKSITPKDNTKIWKKTHSERVLGTKRRHSPVSNRTTSLAPAASTNTITSTDLSTDDYIIRYGALSPTPDYDRMEMVDLQQELKKFGLKQSLKKRQAIICLEYIYNRTHPYIEGDAPCEVVKTKNARDERLMPHDANVPNETKLNFNIGFSRDHLVDAKFQQTEVDQCFLPSWPRAKRPWCLQPLHIAWHNLVKANGELFQTILTYKPIELRDLKIYFKTIDMTFDNKDLIAFLDIHCITFRTSKIAKNS